MFHITKKIVQELCPQCRAVPIMSDSEKELTNAGECEVTIVIVYPPGVPCVRHLHTVKKEMRGGRVCKD